jgi:NCAIR mutase (PurE)-related protein
MREEICLDFDRETRIGLEEAIYSAGKSAAQIAVILDMVLARGGRTLLTRLDESKFAALPASHRERIDYCPVSRTAVYGAPRAVIRQRSVAVVAAGTSDVPVAREAARTLEYHGHPASLFLDVGVAGLWRLTSRLADIRAHPITIVAAGMDAALPSVLGGLVSGPVIAVPTSVGYGVAEGGRAALGAVLASCAPGICVVNIDNGYGAACAALRFLHAAASLAPTLGTEGVGAGLRDMDSDFDHPPATAGAPGSDTCRGERS